MKAAWILAPASMALLGAAYFLPRVQAETTITQSQNDEFLRLRGRLDALEQRSSHKETRIVQLRETVRELPNQDDDEDDRAHTEHPDASLLEREAARTAEVERLYADSFADEDVDPTFRRDMEGKLEEIADVFSKEHLKGTTLTRAECKSTLCRAEFEHSSETEQALLPALLSVAELPEVTIYKRQNADGQLVSIAYLSHALPRLPIVEE